MKRRPVNKAKSARFFRSHTSHTKGINMAQAPQRGGYRL